MFNNDGQLRSTPDVEVFRRMNLIWNMSCSIPCWDHTKPCPVCIPKYNMVCRFHSILPDMTPLE